MHFRNGQHAGPCIGKSRAQPGIGCLVALHAQQARHDREAVLDPMADLAREHLLMRQRLLQPGFTLLQCLFRALSVDSAAEQVGNPLQERHVGFGEPSFRWAVHLKRAEGFALTTDDHVDGPLDPVLFKHLSSPDEVLVQSERRSKRMFTTIRAGMALWATRTMMRASYAPLLVGSRTKKHQPRATASFGVPAPISRRISSPRLCPATWIR